MENFCTFVFLWYLCHVSLLNGLLFLASLFCNPWKCMYYVLHYITWCFLCNHTDLYWRVCFFFLSVGMYVWQFLWVCVIILCLSFFLFLLSPACGLRFIGVGEFWSFLLLTTLICSYFTSFLLCGFMCSSPLTIDSANFLHCVCEECLRCFLTFLICSKIYSALSLTCTATVI